MDRTEMLMRFGFYSGLVFRKLGNASYFHRWYGKAEGFTEEDYSRETAAIMELLVAAGVIRPDEDPWENR